MMRCVCQPLLGKSPFIPCFSLPAGLYSSIRMPFLAAKERSWPLSWTQVRR